MADRLFYATPTGRHPHPGYVASARSLELTCRSFERGVNDFMFAAGPVQMARTTIAEHAINRGYDYVLMHDDDLIIHPVSPVGNPLDAWHNLLDQQRDVAVIGAVYLREKPQIPTVVMSHPQYPEENCHVIHGFPSTPTPVSGIGTGFMMIRVSALRELRDKEDGAHALFRFPFNRTRWGIVNHTGEDYDFCARMRGLGYKVLADSRFETCHLKESGPLVYRHDEWERGWADDAPDITPRVMALRASCQPKIAIIKIGNMLCLDHVPQLISDANEKEATKPTVAKEAA
jgi:hypothetical protein